MHIPSLRGAGRGPAVARRHSKSSAFAGVIVAGGVALVASAVFPFAPARMARGADEAPAAQPGKAIRIVDCGTHVQSRKRGVCENHLAAEDFKALAPGVSWYYNWAVNTNDLPPEGVHMDYYPQAWGNRGANGEFVDVQRLKEYLAAHKPKVVLALNEPNLKGQSFMPPQTAADYYKQIVAALGDTGIPIVGPNMSLGSATGDSITAMDPIDNKQVTYTFMVPYLKAFYHYTGDARVDGTALHTYGNIGELKWATGEMYKQFRKPVWVTEFAEWHAGNQGESLQYLVQAVDFFEQTPYVAGYAFFKERATNNTANISLLKPAPAPPGQLTALGKIYVNMPVHDADLYYRLPGRLAAGCFVSVVNSEIEITGDKDPADGDVGFDMTGVGPATLNYNIQVDKAGDYKVRIRVSDTGKPMQLLEDDKVLAETGATVDGWQTLDATITLPAGPQVLRLHTAGQTVKWMEFSQ